MPAKIDESFDCIAFKRKVQAAHYERTKHMTDEEWIADLRDSVANGPLGDWWRHISQQADADEHSASASPDPASPRNPSTE